MELLKITQLWFSKSKVLDLVQFCLNHCFPTKQFKTPPPTSYTKLRLQPRVVILLPIVFSCVTVGQVIDTDMISKYQHYVEI